MPLKIFLRILFPFYVCLTLTIIIQEADFLKAQIGNGGLSDGDSRQLTDMIWDSERAPDNHKRSVISGRVHYYY